MQDTFLLVYIVVDFKIDINEKNYVEPLHFVTLPRLSLERSLKITEIESKKPTDIKMLLDYENCVRVGMTRVIRHYAEQMKNA